MIITGFIVINVAVSVSLKIAEFLCALSELFARWDPWPFSIAPGALPYPPLSHGAELLCGPSSVLSFRVLTSSLQTLHAPFPFPPRRLLSRARCELCSCVELRQGKQHEAGLDRSKQNCFH